MKVFIWRNIQQLTTFYHSSGGLVIVALDVEQSLGLWAEEWKRMMDEEGYSYDSDGIDVPLRQLPPADLIYEISADTKPEVIVFPNKGCC